MDPEKKKEFKEVLKARALLSTHRDMDVNKLWNDEILPSLMAKLKNLDSEPFANLEYSRKFDMRVSEVAQIRGLARQCDLLMTCSIQGDQMVFYFDMMPPDFMEERRKTQEDSTLKEKKKKKTAPKIPPKKTSKTKKEKTKKPRVKNTQVVLQKK